MITKEDIKNLAGLSRMEINDTEAEQMTSEIDSILGYVGQIKNTKSSDEKAIPKLRNVMREDVVTNKPRQYTEKLLANAPSREKNYLKVKKIL